MIFELFSPSLCNLLESIIAYVENISAENVLIKNFIQKDQPFIHINMIRARMENYFFVCNSVALIGGGVGEAAVAACWNSAPSCANCGICGICGGCGNCGTPGIAGI